MSDVRCGMLLLPEDLGRWPALCRAVEDAGFALLGVGDSQSIFRDVYVALTLAAQATDTIRLGPMVTNAVSRHLVATASAMSSVDEVAGGRAVLGLGSGDSALATVGAPPSSVAGLRDAVAVLRELTAGRPVERSGRHWQVRRAHRQLPIYLSAEGPRTLRLAGELADGVVVGLGTSPEAVELALGYLAEGAAAAGRSVDDLDVWWLVKANLGGVEDIRMAIAASANHAFRFTLEGKALPDRHRAAVGELMAAYRAHHHEVRDGDNATLTDRLGLTGYLADRFAFYGEPADCLAQLHRSVDAGARQFLLTGFVREPLAFIERWGREVLPRV
jgi:5,10-methylenetetrahydromethanopterin reductase